MIPGAAASPSERAWYFAGSLGMAAFDLNSAGRDGRGVGVAELRAHRLFDNGCRLDGSITLNGTSSTAFAGTAALRFLIWPGNDFAPAIEAAYSRSTGGPHESDSGVDANWAGRFSIGTPNLYALTLGRVTDLLLKERSPKLDIRARLYTGAALFAGNQLGYCGNAFSTGQCETANHGGTYQDIGGIATFTVLHIPVSLLISTEQVFVGSHPKYRAQALDGLGVALRMPGFNRDLWLVARAERNRDFGTTTTYRLELTHLLLGAR